MTGSNRLYERDAKAVAGIQKLRFFQLALTGGEGAHLIDEDGRRLIDLSATWGAASLGYGHPALVEAVSRAVARPAGASILSATNLPGVELAEALIGALPQIPDAKVWLGHSGSDANEAAFRTVIAATGRPRILSFIGAYHGGSAAAMSISGHTVLAQVAKAPGLTLLPYPDPDHPFLGDATGARVLQLVEHIFATTCPPSQVAALFIEPIQSDGGLIVPPPGVLAKLVALCRTHGILIVSDEVKVGLARSGKLHCFEHEDFAPDIVCFGKGLGGGLPLSAMVGPARLLDHANAFCMQTLHGNPISAAAGLAVLDTIARERLAEHAARIGARLQERLRAAMAAHPSIRSVRGRGLALGIELDGNRVPGAGGKGFAAKVVYRAFELGAVVYYVGLQSNVLELTPPLVLSADEADEAAGILIAAIGDVEHGKVPESAIAAFAGW